MRLLLLDQFSDPGGAQLGLLELLPAIRERGWEAVVGLPGEGELFDRVKDEGFRAERIECGPYGSGRKSAGDIARFVKGTPRLAGQIRELASGADVVYVNGPRLLPAASMARLTASVVFHAHSHLGPGMTRRMAGVAVRQMGASVIANCEFVAATWRPYARQVGVIWNGVRGADAPSRRTGSTVACIGRIAREKGQVEFVEAAKRVWRDFPDARFVVYGASLFGEEGYEREARARAAGLPVEFAGWKTDVYDELAETDVLLVPSAGHEATTRVILEAYAAGVPVVAFASGGIPEVVADGVTGWLAGSVAEMAARTVELLRDPARREGMGAAAREEWARRFTVERYRGEVLGWIERAVDRAFSG